MKWLLLFLVFIFCLPIFINSYNENRILNGVQTPLGKFMFLPKIYMSYTLKDKYGGLNKTELYGACSSTIISKRHILTAAHCVKRLKNPINTTISEVSLAEPFYVDVRPIEKDISKGIDFTKFGVPSDVHIHEKYNEQYENDIAILEFQKGVDFEITPVLLAKDYVDNYAHTAVAAGYGRYLYDPFTKIVSLESPATLRNVNVQIRSFLDFYSLKEFEVKHLAPEVAAIIKRKQKELICAGISGILPQRIAHGDSGGPLLYYWKGDIFQLGIASFINSENVQAPGCYTRVSHYCDWIEKNTDGEAKCQEMNKKFPVAQPPPITIPITVPATQPVTKTESISTTQQATTTTKSILITEFTSINESLPINEHFPITERPPTAEPINEPLLPNNERSPTKEALKNRAPTFVMNFVYFSIVSFLQFIYVALIL